MSTRDGGAPNYKKIVWRPEKRVPYNNRSFVGSEQLSAQQSWDFQEAAMNMFAARRGWFHADILLPRQNLATGECWFHPTSYRTFLKDYTLRSVK